MWYIDKECIEWKWVHMLYTCIWYDLCIVCACSINSHVWSILLSHTASHFAMLCDILHCNQIVSQFICPNLHFHWNCSPQNDKLPPHSWWWYWQWTMEDLMLMINLICSKRFLYMNEFHWCYCFVISNPNSCNVLCALGWYRYHL